jgi:AcrR family transcriptional regulator
MTDEPAADPSSRETTSSWRELAVARSLDPARVRAEKRVQRFLDAALELMMNSSGKEFTVQDVVERSGQSLRSFYLYFAGKYELLLALFEESVRSTAGHLEQVIAEEDDPFGKLHRFTVEYYRLCQPTPKGKSAAKAPGPAMAEFAQQLLTQHPKEASQAFVPLMELLVPLLDEAAAAGAIRSGLEHRRLAGVLLQSVMFNLFAATISGSPPGDDGGEAAEEFWTVVVQGIGTAQRA